MQEEALEADIAETMAERGLKVGWMPQSLVLHRQAVLQGALILAKAKGGAAVAEASIDHLRRYIELVFNEAGREGNE
jgi:TetR/AcrR family transcriptional regulator, transcriptional repressor for nem operon